MESQLLKCVNEFSVQAFIVLHIKTFQVVLAKCLLRGEGMFLRKRSALFIGLRTAKSELAEI